MEHIVTVDQGRYDELVRKEAMLETIETLHARMTNYVFHDAVGFLFKASAEVNADE
jgi:hypothetical protein